METKFINKITDRTRSLVMSDPNGEMFNDYISSKYKEDINDGINLRRIDISRLVNTQDTSPKEEWYKKIDEFTSSLMLDLNLMKITYAFIIYTPTDEEDKNKAYEVIVRIMDMLNGRLADTNDVDYIPATIIFNGV